MRVVCDAGHAFPIDDQSQRSVTCPECGTVVSLVVGDNSAAADAEQTSAHQPAGDIGVTQTLSSETAKKLPKASASAESGTQAGTRLGSYRLVELLGQGGMGQVYRAHDATLGRDVAIKLISPKVMGSDDVVARFRREVKATAKLMHPGIVTAFDAGEADGMHYLVMEYVAGSDLSAHLKKHGPIPFDLAVEYVTQAAKALAYTHQEGIIHRDIKPSNLLLTDQGNIKILDLGLAGVRASQLGQSDQYTELTGSGTVMGTVDYLSPEQGITTKNADERSDVYSLGCTLYRLITGNVIYPGRTVVEKILAHRDADIPSLRSFAAEIPESLDRTFQQMVAKSPEERPQSMAEVVQRLRQQPASKVATCRLRAISVVALSLLGLLVLATLVWLYTKTAGVENEVELGESAASRTADGFQPLFDGRTLNGWAGSGIETFFVEDGKLVGEFDGDGRRLLLTEKEFKNFHLRIKFRLLTGNSGLHFRKTEGIWTGYQLDIVDVELYPARSEGPFAFWVYRDGFSSVESRTTNTLEKGRWYSYEVIAENQHIIAELDGETILDYSDRHPDRPIAGHVGLEVFGSLADHPSSLNHGKRTKVEFKDIEIREIAGYDNPSRLATSTNGTDDRRIPTTLRFVSAVRQDGNVEIVLCELKGSRAKVIANLSQHSACDDFPSWSPDGKRIAFTSDRNGVFNVYTMNAQGKDVRQLTRLTRADVKPPVHGHKRPRLPTWSPDGETLLYGGFKENLEIFRVRRDGTQINLTRQATFGCDGAWSPNGETIAFVSGQLQRWHLYRMNQDGGDVKQLSDMNCTWGYPCWSPAGDRIVFAAKSTDGTELFACTPEGKDQRQLTELGGDNAMPAYLPNGRGIVFFHRSGAAVALHLMNPDGTDVRPIEGIENSLFEGGRVSWQPTSPR